MITKITMKKSIKTIPTKNIVNQYCTTTNTTTNNNNVPIAYINFSSYPKNYNTSIKQQYDTNPNNNKNNKSSLHNNSQN